MNKEEILEKSRAENRNKDIAELETLNKAGRISSLAGVLLCFAVNIVNVIFTGSASIESFLILTGMLCCEFSVKFFLVRKRHELIVAIMYTVLFVGFVTAYILRLNGVC